MTAHCRYLFNFSLHFILLFLSCLYSFITFCPLLTKFLLAHDTWNMNECQTCVDHFSCTYVICIVKFSAIEQHNTIFSIWYFWTFCLFLWRLETTDGMQYEWEIYWYFNERKACFMNRNWFWWLRVNQCSKYWCR